MTSVNFDTKVVTIDPDLRQEFDRSFSTEGFISVGLDNDDELVGDDEQSQPGDDWTLRVGDETWTIAYTHTDGLGNFFFERR